MYKFDFVIRNLGTGEDSEWISLMQTATEDLEELWYHTITGDNDHEIADFETNLNIPYDSVNYANLDALLALKEFLVSHESLLEAFQIQAALENDYNIFEIVDGTTGYDIFDQFLIDVDDEEDSSLGYAMFKEFKNGLGYFDDDLADYFNVEALGNELSFGPIDDEQAERYDNMSDYEIGQDFLDSVGGLNGISEPERYFDFAAYGEALSWDFHLVSFEPINSGEEKLAWVENN